MRAVRLQHALRRGFCAAQKIHDKIKPATPLAPIGVTRIRYIDRNIITELLKINNFTDQEIKTSYNKLVSDGEHIKKDSLKKQLSSIYVANNMHIDDDEQTRLVNTLIPNEKVDYSEYKKSILHYGERIDKRVYKIGLSFLLTGSSIGIIVPCLPLLVNMLHLTSLQYGGIVGSFAVAKLIGNIPSAYFTDELGRKPVLLSGLLICSLGLSGVALVTLPLPHYIAFSTLICCRFLTGLGVSAFTSGAYTLLTDISTPLNRARSISPVMSAFQAGISVGPALGGILIENFGIATTYLVCGGSLLSVAALVHFMVSETKLDIFRPNPVIPAPKTDLIQGSIDSFSVASKSWREIMATNAAVTDVMSLQFTYWFTLSSVQMVTLPLLMISDKFHLGASEIGTSFALMAIFSLCTNQPSAYFADKKGKFNTILLGGVCLTSAYALLPFASTYYELLCVLVPLSIGSSILQSIPITVITDLVSSSQRNQALSLHRTIGDIGLLAGALFSGVLFDINSAPHINAGIIACSLLYFRLRKDRISKK